MSTILDLISKGSEQTIDDRAEGLKRVCALHLSRGLTAVREAGIGPPELAVYELLEDRGELSVRTNVMIRIPPELDRVAKLQFLEELGPPPRPKSNLLRVESIKLFVDGRIEDAAMRIPYPGRPQDRGTLHMDAEELRVVVGRAVELGWRVGAHAVGDRALDTLLDAYQHVLERSSGLPAGWLAIEHGLVAHEEQRSRAVHLGVGVTVQHPLVDTYATAMLEHWGMERMARSSPVRSWLRAGALMAAGSDGHVTAFDPLRSLYGLATRHTSSHGVIGVDEAISWAEAIRLYTVAGDWLSGDGWGGDHYADLVGFPRCLLAGEPRSFGDLPDPVLTVVAGLARFDPEGRWPDL